MTSSWTRWLLRANLLAVALTVSGIVAAGNAHPQQGYLGLWSNLAEKGVNHGRCKAIGVVGLLIVDSGADVPELVSACRAQECSDVGVELPESIIDTVTPPGARFTNLQNGAVKDNATGLIWLANPNCWGRTIWSVSVNRAAELSPTGPIDCGLDDDSQAGDWRLATRQEIETLVASAVAQGFTSPALTDSVGDMQYMDAGDPWDYINETTIYWTSTSVPSNPSMAYVLDIFDGSTGVSTKTPGATLDWHFAWPVRDGDGPPDACQ